MKVLVKNNSIIIPKTLKKGTIVRVYFSRFIDERTAADVPMAYSVISDTTSLRWNEIEWNPEYYVLFVEVKLPNLFWIFNREWIKAELDREI